MTKEDMLRRLTEHKYISYITASWDDYQYVIKEINRLKKEIDKTTKTMGTMTKEDAKAILKEKQSELRQAEIVMEMHENGVREIKEDIARLEAIINKKDDWRLVEVSDGWQYLYEGKALLMADMMHFAHVRNEGWMPDWEDEHEERWGVTYDAWGGLRVYGDDGWCNDYVFGIAVKSEEIAKEMLEEFSERIERIYNKQY